MRLNFMFIVIAILFAFGCSTAPAKPIDYVQIYPKIQDQKERDRISRVVGEINDKNRNLEKTPAWLKTAYSGIKLRRLNDIPENEFAFYKKLVKDKTVHVIVHPSYYPFFENNRRLSSDNDKNAYPPKNIVERFLDSQLPDRVGLNLIKEQERVARSFIEFMSTERRLMILVIPGDYIKHMTYGYIPGIDEYARYINEITNMSYSVVYIESKEFNYGELSEQNMVILTAFLDDLGIETVLVGGGYLGRCLDGFYGNLKAKNKYDVFVVPEISSVSPMDTNNRWGRSVLTLDGKIDFDAAGRNIHDNNSYGMSTKLERETRRISNIGFYPQ